MYALNDTSLQNIVFFHENLMRVILSHIFFNADFEKIIKTNLVEQILR